MRMLKRYVFGGGVVSPWFADLGLTVLRVFTGLAMALAHGWGKIPPNDGFITGVGEMGFPIPTLFAWAAGASEFFGGLLLAAGLATRPAALAIFCTMFVAAFVRHADDPFRDTELALLFGSVALAFALLGAGRYSVDRFLR